MEGDGVFTIHAPLTIVIFDLIEEAYDTMLADLDRDELANRPIIICGVRLSRFCRNFSLGAITLDHDPFSAITLDRWHFHGFFRRSRGNRHAAT